MKKFYILIALSLLVALNLNAAPFWNTFDADPSLISWSPDRYAPAAFEKATYGGDNRLHIQITKDLADRDPGYQYPFYNTHGRQIQTNVSNPSVMRGKLFIPTSWASSHRRSDIWGVLANASGGITDYPIIGFANTTGSNPTFRVFDNDLPSPYWADLSYSITYDQWYDFVVEFSSTEYKYYINGTLVYTDNTVKASTTQLYSIIVQGYNFGDAGLPLAQQMFNDDYDIYWDDVAVYPYGDGKVENVTQSKVYTNLQSAIDDVTTVNGDEIHVAEGTYILTSNVNINKGLTIKGAGNTLTKFQVSGTGYRFSITANGVTLQDMEIEKTDKTGVQDIILINADNVTIKDNIIHGKFVIGDGDVSRAMVISGGHSGLLIDGNTFYDLRQPAYISGITTGTISDNYTYGTKGWVLEQGNMSFSNNTWGTNVYDIAILSGVSSSYYSDITTMSNANNDAVIEDQRVSPAVLSVVHVDASTSYSTDLGGKYHPYSNIAPAITRVVSGGKILVANGTYLFTSQMNINKNGISIVGLGNVIFKADNSAWSTVNGYKHLIGIIAGTESNPVTISNITMNCNSQCYGLNTYNNAYGNLDDVTINGSKGAGLTVNGSTINATNLNTSANSWGAVNVDPGSGVTTPSVFTLSSGTLDENKQIWSDGTHVNGSATVTVNATGYNQYKVGTIKIWTNRPLANCATITKSGETTIYATIQAAIDAASNGDIINVYPGNYAEVAPNSSFNGGTYQFGLFFSTSKSNITVQGVQTDGTPITSTSNIAAFITTNATNSFGYSGTFVAGTNITLRGLQFGSNTPSDNKCIEVVGNGFTFDACRITASKDIYIGDYFYNENGTPNDFSDDISSIQSYTITNSHFPVAGITIANGAGWTGSNPGSVSGRNITNNTFDGAAIISFAGMTPTIGWYLYPTGAATITGNTFNNADATVSSRYIQSWGDVQAEFPYSSYWANNTFPRKTITTIDGNLDHVDGYLAAPFTNLKRIGNTIQQRITNANAGDIIYVGAGTYNEQVLVNKSVTLNGIGTPKPIVDFTGTVTGKLTLFDISANNVTINNFNFNVDLAKLRSAIIATNASIDNITITNNVIDCYGTPAGSYGDRNAVSVNYGGPTNYRVATGGVDNITFTGNTINAGTYPIMFRAGIAVDEGEGTFTGNTLKAISSDILVRFAASGNVNVSGNYSNGGGMEFADFNTGSGTLSISGNYFDGTFANTYSNALRLKNNYTARNTVVSGNNFTNFVGNTSGMGGTLSLENYQAITIDNNSFTPLANSTTYRHITINTKDFSSSSGYYAPVVGATLINNTFNGSGFLGGTALAFYNWDNDSPTFNAFTIGTAGNENNFGDGIGTYISLDNSTGPVAPNATNMVPWSLDLNAVNNKFAMPSLKLPSDMSLSELFALEGKLYHKFDNSALGLITISTTTDASISLNYNYASPIWIDNNSANSDASVPSGGSAPTLIANDVVFNNNNSVSFAGSTNILSIPYDNNAARLNGNTAKSFFAFFRTSSNVTARQVIFEAGGINSGYSVYVYGNRIYLGVWNTTQRRYFYIAALANTNYLASIEYGAGKVRVSLNGITSGYQTFTGFTTETSENGVGGSFNKTRYMDNISASGITHTLTGKIAEILCYNENTKALRDDVIYYIDAKYGTNFKSIYSGKMIADNSLDSYVWDEGDVEFLAETGLSVSTNGDNLVAKYSTYEPKAGKLALYDVNGLVVKAIYNGDFNKGESIFNVETSGISSGVYFMVVETGFGIESKKVFIVK